MHPQLHHFVRQFAAVIVATLVPVVLTTFVSLPLNLGGHPGELRAAVPGEVRHMT